MSLILQVDGFCDTETASELDATRRKLETSLIVLSGLWNGFVLFEDKLCSRGCEVG